MKKKLILLAILLILSGLFWSAKRYLTQVSSPKSSVNSEEKLLSAGPSPFLGDLNNQTQLGLQTQIGVPKERVKVARAIDGDTIELVDGRRVRYIGIDTPETVDPRKPVECFGKEAAAKNRKLVEGKMVEMEKDVSETDKYGRLLRYVFVPSLPTGGSGLGDNLWINEYLVGQGFAFTSTFPPDIKYQDRLLVAQREAQKEKRGLWGSCPQKQSELTAGECQIKGNISSSGEKIFHLPDCPYWSKTVISEEKGERWFCSEEEAQSAGWRKAQNCP